MTTGNHEAPKQEGAAAVACTDLLDDLRNKAQACPQENRPCVPYPSYPEVQENYWYSAGRFVRESAKCFRSALESLRLARVFAVAHLQMKTTVPMRDWLSRFGRRTRPSVSRRRSIDMECSCN